MGSVHTPPQLRFVPLAMTDDEAMARRWLDALNAASIPAELRIEDARRLVSGSSVFPVGPVFATTLLVLAGRRDEAAALLIDLGWDGRRVAGSVGHSAISQAALISGAVAATVSGVAMVVASLLRGV